MITMDGRAFCFLFFFFLGLNSFVLILLNSEAPRECGLFSLGYEIDIHTCEQLLGIKTVQVRP